jgi:hypothetical protein
MTPDMYVFWGGVLFIGSVIMFVLWPLSVPKGKTPTEELKQRNKRVRRMMVCAGAFLLGLMLIGHGNQLLQQTSAVSNSLDTAPFLFVPL